MPEDHPPVAPAPSSSTTQSGHTASHTEASEASPGMGRYRLLAELGRGGMADVYLAMTAGPGGFSKLLVIKQLRVSDDAHLVGMFLDEARLAARVSHPNIVQTFEVVHEGSRAFMVMEFLDGPSLSRLRRAASKRGQRVPLGIELRILRDALLGLQYAHDLKGYDGKAMGVVHRDFTPQNLIVTYDGDTKIVDFGIAKALDQQSQTTVGMFKGKLTYVPPEQLMGQAVDRRADLFAAGVVLYEAVTGTSPWKEMTNAAITHALASGQIPRLMEAATEYPELAAICDQAMAVDPDDRFSTAEDMRLALDEFVKERKLEVSRADVSAFVSSMLGDVRDRTRQVIEAQLKKQTALPAADTLAQGLPTLDGFTPSPAAKVVGRSLPALMASDSFPDTGRSMRSSAVTPVPSQGVSVAAIAVLVFAILVLTGVIVFLALRPSSPAPVATAPQPVVAPQPEEHRPRPVRAEPPPEETPEPAAASATPTPARVSVRIKSSPSNARLFLDDLELPSNPFQGDYPLDSSVHELRISAPGFVDVRRGVQFERDVTIDISLSRQPPPRPGAPARPPVAETGRSQEPKSGPSANNSSPSPDRSEAKSDDPEYFPPASSVKKPKRQLDSNIEFH